MKRTIQYPTFLILTFASLIIQVPFGLAFAPPQKKPQTQTPSPSSHGPEAPNSDGNSIDPTTPGSGNGGIDTPPPEFPKRDDDGGGEEPTPPPVYDGFGQRGGYSERQRNRNLYPVFNEAQILFLFEGLKETASDLTTLTTEEKSQLLSEILQAKPSLQSPSLAQGSLLVAGAYGLWKWARIGNPLGAATVILLGSSAGVSAGEINHDPLHAIEHYSSLTKDELETLCIENPNFAKSLELILRLIKEHKQKRL